MPYEFLQIETRDNGVVVITLNHPENLNALDVALSTELLDAFDQIAADNDARVLVIRGAGRAFSSGGNLAQMRDGCKDDPGQYMDDLTKAVYGSIMSLLAMDKPSIAMVHGVAYGAALNLALACDLTIAAEGAVFCESFTRLALIPGGYATLLLPEIVGMKRATEICLTAREVPAAEALELGMITKLVPKAELETQTMKLADALADAAPLAMKETLRLLRQSRERTSTEQAHDERQTQISMARTQDFKEGLDAFFEKRKPVFKGK